MPGRVIRGCTEHPKSKFDSQAGQGCALSETSAQVVMDAIRAAPCEHHTLRSLGQLAGLSPMHFARVFRRTFGMSAHQCLIAYRIEMAKRLLLTSTPLAQIAVESGFSDQAHLTNAFRLRVGMTPGRWRAHHNPSEWPSRSFGGVVRPQFSDERWNQLLEGRYSN
jgi:AraC-like DNA-binding protein